MKIINKFLGWFFTANKDICSKIERQLPQSKINIFDLYENKVIKYMNSGDNKIIVDAGGGKSCPFAKYKAPNLNGKVIAVDADQEELKQNFDVDEKIVANIEHGLPFINEEVDIIVSRSVLEHLKYPDSFIRDSKRVLKKNGYLINLFPAKFAPFAIINQILPHSFSRKMVKWIRPEYKSDLGFKAFYNSCYYSKMISMLNKYNFSIIELHLSYYQSYYFNFNFMLFVFSALYEILLRALQMKNLCCYVLVVAKKR